MAWMIVKGIALAGTVGLKALGKVAHFSGLLDSFSSSSKNVTLFKLGDWVRLKVGGESFVTKKKTLCRIPASLFYHLLEADKLIDIPKMQMLKLRLLNQMNITVTPSTGKIKFGRMPKKELEKAHEEEKEKKKEKEEEKEQEKDKHIEAKTEAKKEGNEEEVEAEKEQLQKLEEFDEKHSKDHAEAAAKEHKEKFEKDQDGFWMIDRDPKHFPAILNYLRTGIVTTEEEDLDELLVEAQFYQIKPLVDYIEHTLMEMRRKKERKAILEGDLKGFPKDTHYFAISYEWVQQWKDFIYNQGKPPQMIDNRLLADQELKPLLGKVEKKDYIFVNSDVWMTWWLIYGGGPIIARKSADLYSTNVLSTLWHMAAAGKGKEGDVMCEPERKGQDEEQAQEKGPGREQEQQRDAENKEQERYINKAQGKQEKEASESKTDEEKKEEVQEMVKLAPQHKDKKERQQEEVPEEAKITHDSKVIEQSHRKQPNTKSKAPRFSRFWRRSKQN